MKIAIISKKSEKAQQYSEEFLSWLNKRSVRARIFKSSFTSQDLDDVQLVVVVGGDGTLLHTARTIKNLNIPIVGINMGGLGFLTELSPEEAYKAFEEFYLKGVMEITKRMMLKVSLLRKGRVIKNDEVLNDCVINKGNIARIIEMNAYVNDMFLYSLKADGLIISTPTGSTAYVLSAGGPILTPELRCITLCPICPHTLTNRPIVLSNDSEVRVTIMSDSEVFLTLDGQEGLELKTDDEVIVKESEIFISIVKSPFKSYFQILRTKLHWGIR